jgi:hypothetical protein
MELKKSRHVPNGYRESRTVHYWQASRLYLTHFGKLTRVDTHRLALKRQIFTAENAENAEKFRSTRFWLSQLQFTDGGPTLGLKSLIHLSFFIFLVPLVVDF